MTRRKALLLGTTFLVAGAITAAAVHRPTVTPSLLVDKTKASESGRSMATLEIVADPEGMVGAFAMFKLITVDPQSGMLWSTRRALALEKVTWPVVIELRSRDKGVVASATFEQPTTGSAGQVEIRTSDSHPLPPGEPSPKTGHSTGVTR